MEKVSAEGVIRFCEMLHKSGAVYLWGADVEIITADLIDSLKDRFGTSKYSTVSLARVEGLVGADCSGMLKPLSGKDNTASGYYASCVKKGLISNIPKDKVCLIFRRENGGIVHVAVYAGDGTLYEMRNGCEHRKFVESQWHCYGIPDWIEQTEKPLVAGDKVTIGEGVTGHRTAADAIAKKNVCHTLVPGEYIVYKVYGKAANVTKSKGTPGSWIVL